MSYGILEGPIFKGAEIKCGVRVVMLILTTNALEGAAEAAPLTSWPGLHVLVALPGSGYDRRSLEALNDRFVIVEWLENPENTTALLADVIGWLERSLSEDEGPLLFLDQSLDEEVEADASSQIPSLAVDAKFSSDGKIKQLVLGEAMAANPLLPDLFRRLIGRELEDRLFIEVLTDLFVWKDV